MLSLYNIKLSTWDEVFKTREKDLISRQSEINAFKQDKMFIGSAIMTIISILRTIVVIITTSMDDDTD